MGIPSALTVKSAKPPGGKRSKEFKPGHACRTVVFVGALPCLPLIDQAAVDEAAVEGEDFLPARASVIAPVAGRHQA